jgi:hypothetical protein
MSDSTHLLIPFASSHADGCAQARATLVLPQLEKLLARLAPAGTDAGDETALSMPHERTLARACGIAAPDGLIPWGAWQARQAGADPQEAAWALITPCHWRVGQDHVAMDHPASLQLDERGSRELLAIMRPYFQGDGIALEYHAPTLWLASGELFRTLPTASLDRVVGRPVDPWLPRTPGAGALRRLQQEMQMLLYTHEVSEERLRQGALPVNSFWISGTGALPPGAAPGLPADLVMPQALREAALAGDWPAWAAAWQRVDTDECGRLVAALDQGRPVTLTLCGERNAQSWVSSAASGGWWRKLGSAFSGKRALASLDTL